MTITETQSVLESILSNAIVAFGGSKVKEVSDTITRQVIRIGGDLIVFCTVSPIDKSHKPTVIWGFENE